jgi:hypothetical protein
LIKGKYTLFAALFTPFGLGVGVGAFARPIREKEKRMAYRKNNIFFIL